MAGEPGLRLHLYCRVVDNYGDAGVSWRLARQLAAEHGMQVTLWIDRPDVLRQLAPSAPWEPATPGPGRATAEGAAATRHRVTVQPWPDDADDCLPDPDIVVCAFGCEPPPRLRARLAGAPARPLWINLEYLSAETWVDGCHGLAAIKPADGAREHFFFPGFRPGTGGLLREHDLIARRDAFRRGDTATRWWQAIGLPALPGRRVSVFCYPDAPVLPLLRHLAAGPDPTLVVIPRGVAEAALTAFLATPPGTACSRHGRLVLARPAWLDIDDYDRLLWSCDLNLVRGEDSWIRALWAGRPMVWQPYHQADGAHRAKLEAFLAWRRQPAWLAADEAIEAFSRAWSEGTDPTAAWAALDAVWPALDTAAATLAAGAARTPDLATQLVSYCRSRL